MSVPAKTLLQPTTPLKEAAPAKVNLWLEITGRRGDGYHLLDSLVVFAEAADRLEAHPAERFSLQVTGPFASALDQGEDTNLVLRAVEVFCRVTGDLPGFTLTLTKNLPVAAGLGGGSADAAATLRLLERLKGERLPGDVRRTLALELGADVPACLLNRPLHMSGIGEQLEPLAGLPDLHLLLVNPGVPVSTGAIFRQLSPSCSETSSISGLARDLDSFLEQLRHRRNDLEPPARALVPQIGHVLSALRDTQGCALARMSGSGASCFALYRSRSERKQAAIRLGQEHPGWWIA